MSDPTPAPALPGDGTPPAVSTDHIVDAIAGDDLLCQRSPEVAAARVQDGEMLLSHRRALLAALAEARRELTLLRANTVELATLGDLQPVTVRFETCDPLSDEEYEAFAAALRECRGPTVVLPSRDIQDGELAAAEQRGREQAAQVVDSMPVLNTAIAFEDGWNTARSAAITAIRGASPIPAGPPDLDALIERATAAIREACPSDEVCAQQQDEQRCFRDHPVHWLGRSGGEIVSVTGDPAHIARVIVTALWPAVLPHLGTPGTTLGATAPAAAVLSPDDLLRAKTAMLAAKSYWPVPSESPAEGLGPDWNALDQQRRCSTVIEHVVLWTFPDGTTDRMSPNPEAPTAEDLGSKWQARLEATAQVLRRGIHTEAWRVVATYPPAAEPAPQPAAPEPLGETPDYGEDTELVTRLWQQITAEYRRSMVSGPAIHQILTAIRQETDPVPPRPGRETRTRIAERAGYGTSPIAGGWMVDLVCRALADEHQPDPEARITEPVEETPTGEPTPTDPPWFDVDEWIGQNITINPVPESVRSDWWRAECSEYDCHWHAGGGRRSCEDAASEHAETHRPPVPNPGGGE